MIIKFFLLLLNIKMKRDKMKKSSILYLISVLFFLGCGEAENSMAGTYQCKKNFDNTNASSTVKSVMSKLNFVLTLSNNGISDMEFSGTHSKGTWHKIDEKSFVVSADSLEENASETKYKKKDGVFESATLKCQK